MLRSITIRMAMGRCFRRCCALSHGKDYNFLAFGIDAIPEVVCVSAQCDRGKIKNKTKSRGAEENHVLFTSMLVTIRILCRHFPRRRHIDLDLFTRSIDAEHFGGMSMTICHCSDLCCCRCGGARRHRDGHCRGSRRGVRGASSLHAV